MKNNNNNKINVLSVKVRKLWLFFFVEIVRVLQSLWWTMFGGMSHNYLDTLCLLNRSTWLTELKQIIWTEPFFNFFLGLPYPSYGLGIPSKMTKCAISTFVTKYSFYGILYPYSTRHNIRTIKPIITKFWQELKQLTNFVLSVVLD